MEPSLKYQLAGAHVISDTIEGDTIIVDLNSGVYYSLGGAGAIIWSLVSGGMDEVTLAQVLATLYSGDPLEIADAARALVAELLAEGLILPRDGETALSTPAVPTPTTTEPQAFQRPVLAKYDDMADLLLLDPIHEVDESGWPHPRPNRGA